MKKFILIICVIGFITLLTPQSCFSQVYTSFSVDVNNLLSITDNPRMKKQVNGLDFDIEIGAIDKNIGVGLFYGAFTNANYQNYGVSLDYYINVLERFKISFGNRYHVVIRKGKHRHMGTTSSYVNPRVRLSYDLSFLIIEFISEFTNRKDIDKTIYEGKIGLRKQF